MDEGYLRPEEFLFGLVTSAVLGLVMRLPQPQQASLGGVPMDELVGYSLDTFASALDLVEAQLGEGQSVRVQLCTDRQPTEDELADIFLGMAAGGSHVSMPSARMVDGVSTTEFAITKGSPIFLAIIPVLAPLLTIGLIAWGITKIENITRALVPIVLISLGGVIVLAALARQPAAKYIERGGRVPLLPAARKPTRSEVVVESWKERDRLGIWIKDKRTGKTVAEWWDDEARQMFEDGFFKPGVPEFSYEKPSWQFVDSVLDYAEDMGMLAGRTPLRPPKKALAAR